MDGDIRPSLMLNDFAGEEEEAQYEEAEIEEAVEEAVEEQPAKQKGKKKPAKKQPLFKLQATNSNKVRTILNNFHEVFHEIIFSGNSVFNFAPI